RVGIMVEETWEEVDDELAAHPSVRKIGLLGYQLRYKHERNRPFLMVEASLNGRRVGWLRAEMNRGLGQVHADNIVVTPQHQRLGVASAMMVCTEAMTGLTMVPARNQTEEGRALWGQPNRPFGNPKCPDNGAL